MSLALSLCQYVLRPRRGLDQASPGLAQASPSLKAPRLQAFKARDLLHQHNRKFFSVLRLCGSRQVVAPCRADERITQMHSLYPSLGVQKWSKITTKWCQFQTKNQQRHIKKQTPTTHTPNNTKQRQNAKGNMA